MLRLCLLQRLSGRLIVSELNIQLPQPLVVVQVYFDFLQELVMPDLLQVHGPGGLRGDQLIVLDHIQSALRALACHAADFLGKLVKDFFPEYLAGPELEHLHKCVLRARFPRRGGIYRWLQGSVQLLFVF